MQLILPQSEKSKKIKKNPYFYRKFHNAKYSNHQNIGEGTHTTEDSRFSSDCLLIVQNLEIDRGIPDCQLR